jgi:methionyl-tRNA synthetase
VLCANAPETKDNDFTWKDFQDRNNSELVSIFGNFVNRAFVLMHKLCKGKVPAWHEKIKDEADAELIRQIELTKTTVEHLIETYKFRDALYAIIDLARKGNKYLQDKEPWKKAGKETTLPEDQEKINNCLFLCLQLTANLSILINPFLPVTSRKMLHMMKVVDRMLDWEHAGKIDLLKTGYSLRAPELLFRKIEDEEIQKQMDKLHQNSVKPDSTTESPSSPAREKKVEIQYGDFEKLELRTGIILSAEKVAKADKLLKLEVDLGFEKRTIVSGIALHFDAENIIGKQVVVVANLAPRKMKGIESNGMILMAEEAGGKLIFVNPDEKTTAGSEVK